MSYEHPEQEPVWNAPDEMQPLESTGFPDALEPSLAQRIETISSRYSSWADQHPVKATIAETVALYGLRRVIETGVQRTGIRVGNAFSEQHIDEATVHPVRGFLMATVAAPVVEELIFRGMIDAPSRQASEAGQHGRARVQRLASALLFAAGHAGAIRPHENWPKAPYVHVTTEGTTAPVGQLMGGLNYQRLNNSRGFWYGVLGHAANNTLASVAMIPEVIRNRKAR